METALACAAAGISGVAGVAGVAGVGAASSMEGYGRQNVVSPID